MPSPSTFSPSPSSPTSSPLSQPTTPSAATDIASTMGFSAFGSHPPAKKKRRKTHDDVASGGNAMPLRTPAVLGGGRSTGYSGVREKGNSSSNSGGGEKIDGDITSTSTSTPAELLQLHPHPHRHNNPINNHNENNNDTYTDDRFDGHSWVEWRRGVRDLSTGDVAFYDGSFVEDPWRDLKSKGKGHEGRG